MEKIKHKKNQIKKIIHHVKSKFSKKTKNNFEAQEKHKSNLLFKYVLIPLIIFLALLVIVGKNKTTAEILIDEFVTALRSKLGFEYTSDPLSDYVFSKETPNYNAFAADKKLAGGHRMMLERGGVTLEIKFKSAEITKQIQNQAIQENAGNEATPGGRINSLQGTLDSLNSQLEEITSGLQDISQKISDIEKSVSEVTAKGKMVPEGKERKVLFQDIVFGTDLDYGLSEGGIIQEIILKDQSKLNNEFNFALTHPDLSYKDVGNGVWYFSNKDNKIMRIPKGYAVDSEGKFTNDVTIEVKTTLLVTIMTVKIPQDWLEAKERVYPVKVHTAFEIVPSLRDGTSRPIGNPTDSNSVARAETQITPTLQENAVSSNGAELLPTQSTQAETLSVTPTRIP